MYSQTFQNGLNKFKDNLLEFRLRIVYFKDGQWPKFLGGSIFFTQYLFNKIVKTIQIINEPGSYQIISEI